MGRAMLEKRTNFAGGAGKMVVRKEAASTALYRGDAGAKRIL